ncbi:uncharacterized protein LAJ45_01965 [Morchella importuna]|uniref:uncharacterized protein n=1 Tax=Morchella importuna TaxID=1174673 RepID=UPI001E8E0106|nr:uncharacterized protein LAJ45_01965 [Morchella importuna]KAH8154197.1 hypothetical protein LAJ45_01965 [Morchella importuna]
MSTQSIYPTTSSLQYQSSSHPSLQHRQNPQKMSITQTFYLAHKARGKLSSEASRSDHNLRLLVGHANLLDTLMIHLSEAERDQETWYNNTVRGNEESRESVQQWPETIPEETEEYGSLAADYESDSESSEEEEEEEDEDEEMMDLDMSYDLTLTREPSHPSAYTKYYQTHGTVIGVSEVGEDDEEYEDDCDEDGMFSLTRTTSHRPPSLCSDLSDDEDEDSNPPSPPQPTMSHPPMSHKEQEQARAYFEHNDTPGLSEERGSLFEHDYFVPDRSSPTMISTF